MVLRAGWAPAGSKLQDQEISNHPLKCNANISKDTNTNRDANTDTMLEPSFMDQEISNLPLLKLNSVCM